MLRVVHGLKGLQVGSQFFGFWRVGSGQHFFYLFLFLTDYYCLVPESILIFEYYIRVDRFFTIFNLYDNYIIILTIII